MIKIKKFAYNESSFFLIRLLQNFSLVSLSEESQPPDSRAPQIWKLEAEGGRKSKEKIQPKSHLTMFLKVMFFFFLGFQRCLTPHSTLSFFLHFIHFLFLNIFFQGGLWVKMEEAVSMDSWYRIESVISTSSLNRNLLLLCFPNKLNDYLV